MQRDATPFGEFAIPAHVLAGAHTARVTSVDDPDHLARVKVELHVADSARDIAIWARVASPFAGAGRGGFFIPQVDDEVLVVFVNGDARAPVVIGGLWNGSAHPPETLSGRVDRWTLTGKAGTKISIIEESDATAKIVCQTPGGVKLTMTDEGGGKVEIVCARNTIKIDSSGVSVKAASKISLDAPTIEMKASSINANCGLSKFSSVVRCDTMQTNATVSTSYTPGAGSIW